MPSRIQNTPTDLIHHTRFTVFKKKIPKTLIPEPPFSLRKNVFGISPDEVGSVPVGNHDPQIRAVFGICN